MTFPGINLVLIITNIIFSYQGLKNHAIFDRYNFEVDKILLNKEYRRLITSGFFHVSWMHLLFNMFSFYFFSSSVIAYLGEIKFLLIYFSSLLGGNLFTLFIHRNHGEYSAAGASGAISGIIFASIALFPSLGIGFFGLPFFIPAWLYGLLYMLFTLYGIRSRKDNIGHEAHLGGALIGMLFAIIMHPLVLADNYPTILIISVPALIFIYIVVTRPHLLLVDNFFFKKHQRFHSIEHKYNSEKVDLQKEIDRILEKIHQRGIGSLSNKERNALEKFAKKD